MSTVRLPMEPAVLAARGIGAVELAMVPPNVAMNFAMRVPVGFTMIAVHFPVEIPVLAAGRIVAVQLPVLTAILAVGPAMIVAAATLAGSGVVMRLGLLALLRHPRFHPGAESLLQTGVALLPLLPALDALLDPLLPALRPPLLSLLALGPHLLGLRRLLPLGLPFGPALLALLALRPRLLGLRRLLPLQLPLGAALLALFVALLVARVHFLRRDGRRHRRGHQNSKQCLSHSKTPHTPAGEPRLRWTRCARTSMSRC